MATKTKVNRRKPGSVAEFDIRSCAQAKVNKALAADDKIALYRRMVAIRRFEERSLRAYQQGKIAGFLHLYIGQEAVATGAVSVMGAEDQVITAYRDHGHALACGMGMRECMAELFGKTTGCCKGKGGSMHLFAPEKRFWGGHGIVAGQTPLGAGIAFALKYQQKRACCLCFLGDGATNQGAFYESLNLASLWDLPVVFIIENNGYSMGTAVQRHSAGLPLTKRGTGVGMESATCNGHLIYEVRAKTAEAIARAYDQSKPTLIEVDTYRYRGHSVSDPDQTYRTKKEVEDYRKNRDPITIFREILREEEVMNDEQASSIDREIRKAAEEAARFADESPFPPAEELTRDIYWEEDNPEEKTSRGTIFFN